MRLSGTLRTWNDDRGFGFISPTHGGAEIFVHISALPRDGTRPTTGEKLSYELGRGKDGKPQAINVIREAIGLTPRKQAVYQPIPNHNTSIRLKIVGILLVLVIGAYGYKHYDQRASHIKTVAEPMSPAQASIAKESTESSTLKCDERIHCSQMTSCSEAKFFLNNCPGTKMDGDRDGIPCELQWCGN